MLKILCLMLHVLFFRSMFPLYRNTWAIGLEAWDVFLYHFSLSAHSRACHQAGPYRLHFSAPQSSTPTPPTLF